MWLNKKRKSVSADSSALIYIAGALNFAIGLILHCFVEKFGCRGTVCFVNIIFENIGFIGDLIATLGVLIILTSLLFSFKNKI